MRAVRAAAYAFARAIILCRAMLSCASVFDAGAVVDGCSKTPNLVSEAFRTGVGRFVIVTFEGAAGTVAVGVGCAVDGVFVFEGVAQTEGTSKSNGS